MQSISSLLLQLISRHLPSYLALHGRGPAALKLYLKNGFTIVELLVVIVVIGILAGLTIVAYNGVQRGAVESSMKTELRSGSKLVETKFLTNGQYPSDLVALNNGQTLVASSGSTYTYNTSGTGYCLAITNSKTPNRYKVTSSDTSIQAGSCDVTVSTILGTTQGYLDATGLNARFYYGYGMARSGDSLYIADMSNNRIRKASLSTSVVTTLAGSTQGYAEGAGASVQFNFPRGLATDVSGNVYVADYQNHLIRKVTPAGATSVFAGRPAGTPSSPAYTDYDQPHDIEMGSDGYLYTLERNGRRVRKISPAGEVTTIATSATPGFGSGFAEGITVDASGNIYVVDTSTYRILKITQTGTVTTVAGASGAFGSVDGNGPSARFEGPTDVVIDKAGNLYVADRYRIRKIDTAGVVSTFVGPGINETMNIYGTTDGNASAARFSSLLNLLFIDDTTLLATSNNTVRKISFPY